MKTWFLVLGVLVSPLAAQAAILDCESQTSAQLEALAENYLRDQFKQGLMDQAVQCLGQSQAYGLLAERETNREKQMELDRKGMRAEAAYNRLISFY